MKYNNQALHPFRGRDRRIWEDTHTHFHFEVVCKSINPPRVKCFHWVEIANKILTSDQLKNRKSISPKVFFMCWANENLPPQVFTYFPCVFLICSLLLKFLLLFFNFLFHFLLDVYGSDRLKNTKFSGNGIPSNWRCMERKKQRNIPSLLTT